MRRGVVLVAAALLVAAAAAVEPAAGHADRKMQMVGNMDPYPDLSRAGRRNVRRARRLLRASRSSAHAFDTMAKASRLGYRVKRRFRPGFTHMRKHGTRFWGRVFDPSAPQSLVFWCPSHGRCTLTTYMYRAPGGNPPSTWHDLLQWHRHARTRSGTWATHVWLVEHTREGFATCAPWKALTTSLRIEQEPYRAIEADRPCKDDAPMAP